MSIDWLAPVRAALDDLDTVTEVFFRDDDAGWADDRLYALLDCFGKQAIPLDLALIPQALTQPLADALLQRRQCSPATLGLHQHGYSHSNHETSARKCEFGPSRNYAHQYQDLWLGKARLEAMLGPVPDKIFTPPWNRCTTETANCLIDLGFQALSRDMTATALHLNNLAELPVGIDWCGIRAKNAKPWSALADAISQRLFKASTNAIGIMLHHAVMDTEDLAHLHPLLELFSTHPKVDNRLMRECLATG
ncbi:MAG: hypothetical protein ABL925_07440 [Methylococcales bacterium]